MLAISEEAVSQVAMLARRSFAVDATDIARSRLAPAPATLDWSISTSRRLST
jgi:hypothetical protein